MATSSIPSGKRLIAAGLALAVSATAAITSTSAFASGGVSGGSSGVAPRPVDESYEYGKAVYLGRLPNVEKMDYCVLVDGLPKKVKKKTLKPFRGKTTNELANSLYRCDDASQLALRTLEKDQVAFVLYYLNKRFRLKLTDA